MRQKKKKIKIKFKKKNNKALKKILLLQTNKDEKQEFQFYTNAPQTGMDNAVVRITLQFCSISERNFNNFV